ncbi:ABC transporter substrate-binding protein [Xenophilus sp. AP218F]|nr:transporter substrate-binding domain-containing protein [Chromobacterium sp. ASV5]OWY38019.1 ABC transporter substrate-binding protein [Xenophilus sp. AP218F]
MKRRRSLAAWAALCLWSGPNLAEPLTVTILVDDSYPPYSYRENDQAAGVYNDILRAASDRLPGYRIELKPIPWKRGLAELESGEAMALSPPYYRPRDRPFMQPYSVPMLKEQVAAFCRADALRAPRRNWPADYLDLAFGINAGFRPGGDAFWQAVRQRRVRLEEAPNARANLLKLIHGRIDCYLNDKLAIELELAELQRRGDYQPDGPDAIRQGPVISEENGYVGFSARSRLPYQADFVRQLNAALVELKRSGKIDQIVARALRRPAPP